MSENISDKAESENKSDVSSSIQKIIDKKTDPHGDQVIKILSSQNEFCIYEIDRKEISQRLRILMEGRTDAREKELTSRFEKISQSYTKAKGMLYPSSNDGIMLSRIAHALASCLSNDDEGFDGNQLFETICNDIAIEQKRIVVNRICYISPVIILILISCIQCYAVKDHRIDQTPLWQISSSLLAVLLGVGVSIYTGSQKLNFEEFRYTRFYAYLGVERVIFGAIFGAIAFMAIKSGLVSTNLMEHGYWANLIIITTAGFSEHFTPSIIRKNE